MVKGGHLKGMAIDILYDGKDFNEIEGPRIETKNTHGTGCTFASAIATLLARGDDVPEAVRKAKTFITMAIQSSLSIGKGTGPTNPSAYVLREMERYQVIQELKRAVEILKEEKVGHLIPEVSSNLAMPFPMLRGSKMWLPFQGGSSDSKIRWPLRVIQNSVRPSTLPILFLTVTKFDPEYCSAMNIRYSKENVSRLRRKGFLVGHFDRRLEPKKVKEKEGSSLEWGVGEVLRKMRRVPDFIYDEGDVGKEPMIRVLGRNPMEVIQKILKAVGRRQ